ncbi:MAG: hypothetical protein ACR2OU_17350 [Thermomicrobiales bacterium]
MNTSVYPRIRPAVFTPRQPCETAIPLPGMAQGRSVQPEVDIHEIARNVMPGSGLLGRLYQFRRWKTALMKDAMDDDGSRGGYIKDDVVFDE